MSVLAATLPGYAAPDCPAAAMPIWRRSVAAITALAFLIKLLGVLLLLPVPPADTGRSWVPICTVYGLKWIELDKDGKPASDTPLPDRPCPLCLAGAACLPFLVPAVPRLTLPGRPALNPPQPWATDAPVLRLAARPPPSRAPPSLTL